MEFYTSIRGRVSRKQFWTKLVLPAFVIGISLGLLESSMGKVNPETGVGTFTSIFFLIYAIVGIIVGIKRLHDRNKSGWWIFISFIPIIGFIWWIIELGCLRGTVGRNRFGDDPLELL